MIGKQQAYLEHQFMFGSADELGVSSAPVTLICASAELRLHAEPMGFASDFASVSLSSPAGRVDLLV